MLHEAEVSCATPPQVSGRLEADSVDVTIAKVICGEVVRRVEFPVTLLSQE
jgi:hypothetical protein